MKIGTKAIHAGQKPDPSTGAIMTPIYQTSTYVQTAPGEHKGFEYARSSNPTRSVIEACLASLENAKHALCFGSGLASIEALMKLLEPGDEVIVSDDIYGGTFRLFTKVYEVYGLKFKFIDMANMDAVNSAINAHTKMLWLETPTNPILKIIDIEKLAKIGKQNNLITVVDNTFSSPYLQNPLDLGADVVMHSATKYLSGHSDVIMGALCMSDDAIYKKMAFIQNSCGAVPGPQDCFLVLRGLKTLHIRMERHCENGRKIAHYLKDHPKVEKVIWPGFESHPNHDIAKKQMKDFGGMISVILKGDKIETAFEFLKHTHLFALAESLGGVESLIGHPATMTHAAIPKEDRLKAGLSDALIRISVGIEDIDDLIEDLENALNKI